MNSNRSLKKSVPPQIFFKRIHSYFRADYQNQLLVRVTQNTVPKEFLIQENVLHRFLYQQSCRRSIQHLICSKRNCCKTLRAFPKTFPEAFSEAHPGAFLQTIPCSPFFILPFAIQDFNDSLSLCLYQYFVCSSKYMAYENKIIGMGQLFNTNSSIWHALN